MRRLLLVLALILSACSGAPSQASPTAPPTSSSTAPASATATSPATPGDDEEWWLGGTITWTASGTDNDITESVSGSAYAVIHVIDPYLMLAERDTGSTYSYDYTSNTDICPSSHEDGTLESQAGVGTTAFWDFSIGTLNVSGPPGNDLALTISMPDYCGGSLGADAGRPRDFNGFPDCEPGGDQLFARFDGVDSYVIDCDVIGYGPAGEFVGTASGHVSGTLSRIDAPI